MHVGCACSRSAAGAARGVPRRCQAQLPRRCAIKQPTSKDAFIDEGAAPGGQPLAIERARTKPARPDGVINDRDPLGEYPFAQRIQEEAGFAGNGCARHAADQMSDQAGADSGRSEEHTSELQSLMRISYAVFCLKKKKKQPISIISSK